MPYDRHANRKMTVWTECRRLGGTTSTYLSAAASWDFCIAGMHVFAGLRPELEPLPSTCSTSPEQTHRLRAPLPFWRRPVETLCGSWPRPGGALMLPLRTCRRRAAYRRHTKPFEQSPGVRPAMRLAVFRALVSERIRLRRTDAAPYTESQGSPGLPPCASGVDPGPFPLRRVPAGKAVQPWRSARGEYKTPQC